MKKLYCSKTEKQIAGVCGGIAVYFNIDPTVVRIIFVLVSLFSASIPGLLIVHSLFLKSLTDSIQQVIILISNIF